MRDGLKEAIDREVETLRREGLPIYVSDNGKVSNLQEAEPPGPVKLGVGPDRVVSST